MFSFLQSAVSWWTAQDLHYLIRSLPSVSLDRDSKRVRGKSSLYLGSLCQTLEMCRAPWQPLRTWRRLTIFWWAFRSKAITSPTPTRVFNDKLPSISIPYMIVDISCTHMGYFGIFYFGYCKNIGLEILWSYPL